MAQIKYLLRVSACFTAVSKMSTEAFVKDRLDLVLGVLPKGTKVVSVEQQAISDLSVPFLVTLEHPVFKEGTYLETDWARDCWISEEPIDGNLIHQVTIFQGIRYLLSDGTDMYRDRFKT